MEASTDFFPTGAPLFNPNVLPADLVGQPDYVKAVYFHPYPVVP